MAISQPLEALESLVRELCSQVRSYGWCADARIIRDHDVLNYHERVRIAFRMVDGQTRTHEINLTELAMEPDHVAEIFRNWRRNVILDLEAYHAPIAAQMDRQRQQQVAMMQQQMAGLQQWAQTQTQANPEAEARSKELFISAAGKKAFDDLSAGKSIALTGSKGGKYTLHKRSSFCAERTSDGARLCAVVPGVPLWDHLLGIKLMIEHDELKFLKTANVSGGHAIAQGTNRNIGGALGGLGGILGGFFG